MSNEKPVSQDEPQERPFEEVIEESNKMLFEGQHKDAVEHLRKEGYKIAAQNLEDSLKGQGILK